MPKMTYVTYVCSSCGAKDTDKFFSNERPHLTINCYRCHAGQGLTIEEMLSKNKGMFPEQSKRAAAS